MRRYELTGEQWALSEPVLPSPAETGQPRRPPARAAGDRGYSSPAFADGCGVTGSKR